jgi:hypothetical protein
VAVPAQNGEEAIEFRKRQGVPAGPQASGG